MCEVLTMAQIEERYDGEWVLLEDPDVVDDQQVVGGKLLWHSKDKDEVYRRARQLRPRHWAVFYIGTVPDDVVIVL